MALLFVDPFESFPEGFLDTSPLVYYLSGVSVKSDRSGGYAASIPTVVSGKLSDRCLRLYQNTNPSSTRCSYIKLDQQIENKLITVGFAFSASNSSNNIPSGLIPLQDATRSIIRFSSNHLSALKLNSDWSLSMGGLTTAPNILVDSVYSYIEITLDVATGYFELFVNNVSAGTGTVTFTGAKYVLFGQLNGGRGAAYGFYDDIYLLDDTGSTHNSRLGPVRAVRVPFNSTAEANFTSFGTTDNITAINKNTLDTSSFNRSPASNNVGDYFKLDTSVLPSDRPIIAVQQSAMYRKTDIGERALKLVAKEGVDRKEHPLPDRLVTFSGGPAQILETAADGSAWDLTNLAATDFGYEVTE